MKDRVICITGIDTDIGKTVATGLLGRSFVEHGIETVTQKMVQTGCEGISEDIITHREIMGLELLDVDKNGVTCPYVFTTPCSPHLAAKIEGRKIEVGEIKASTEKLLVNFQAVLLEGAGGLSVPIVENFTFLDYVADEGYPVILVTSPRLGSINHTVNALELAYHRKVEIIGVIYNHFEDADSRIVADSREIFKFYLNKFGFQARIADIFQTKNLENFATQPDLYQELFAAE